MVDHTLCGLPRGMRAAVALYRGLKRPLLLRAKKTIKLPTPALAFLVEDADDNTACSIFVTDCYCQADPTCPRVRLLKYAADHYNSTAVFIRPAFSAAKAVRASRKDQ